MASILGALADSVGAILFLGSARDARPAFSVPLMKQRKIAISLAVVGAIVAPLVFRTYKASPSVSGFLPLTVERREEITAYLARLKNCEEFETIPMDKLPPEADDCFYRRGLLRQGEYFSYFSVPKYLALTRVLRSRGSGSSLA
jgi:hypothetical protein